jgi:cation diffusion facilitator CzcD-associated flavoprotein CzcO
MRAQFVICANGTLAKPKLSTIKGMTSFAGHSFHTSRWDYDYTGVDLENLKDKVVGIIGTGASAVQIVPELAKNAKQLYVFQRTPSSIDVREDWPTDPNWARKLEPGWQATRRAKVLAVVENSLEKRAAKGATSPEEKLRKQENANIDYMMRIHRRIDKIVDDQETADALKPWYMFMCKRPCFHNDYLPAFNRPNVQLVDTKGEGITEIGPKGPVFNGKEYDVDVLIYATGFEVQQTGIYNTIVGEANVNLQDKYADGIRTLLGIHTAGFPNLFIMGGYQASFQFNLTDMLQTQGDHIAACIDYVRSNGYHSLDVSDEAEQWWVDEVINHRGKTTRSEECTPGYYNMEGDSQRRQDGNYNGGFRQYFEHQGEVREKMEENFNLKAKPA